MGGHANCRFAFYRTLYHHHHCHHYYNLLLVHLINPAQKWKCGHYFSGSQDLGTDSWKFPSSSSFFLQTRNQQRSDISPPLPPPLSTFFIFFFQFLLQFTTIILRLTHSILSDGWSLALGQGTTMTPRSIKFGTFWVSIVHSDVCCSWLSWTMTLDS